jgi:hypothetical protein
MDKVEFTHNVPTAFLEVINERMAGFTRRANKKGLPVPVISLGEKSMKLSCRANHEHSNTCPRTEWTMVTISGNVPRIGPWALIASVDNVEGNPFFRPVPGAIVPERFRDADPTACDYCNTNRYRTETFIVHNSETDAYTQVGRQCVRDFLGWDISTLVAYWERFGSLIDDSEDYGPYIQPTWHPTDIIGAASAVVSVDGKYHKSAEYEDSTKEKVFILLSAPRNKYDEETHKHYHSQPERAKQIYDATMAALVTLNTSSDWAYNVKTASNAEYVGVRQVGVLASAVILGMRAIEDAATRDASKNSFIGSIGDKVTLSVTLKDERYIDSYYGGSHLYTFITSDGNIIKWFASNRISKNIGDVVTLTGTVKKHDEYKGTNSTVLTRCKVA